MDRTIAQRSEKPKFAPASVQTVTVPGPMKAAAINGPGPRFLKIDLRDKANFFPKIENQKENLCFLCSNLYQSKKNMHFSWTKLLKKTLIGLFLSVLLVFILLFRNDISSQEIEDQYWTPESQFVNEDDLNTTLQVYPNPTNSILWIKTNEKTAFTAEIYDVLGKKLFTKDFAEGQNPQSLSVQDLPTGTYLLQIKTKQREIGRASCRERV
jgi:hypothetical protein